MGADAAECIERWYRAALAAVEPEAAVRAHIGREGQTLVLDGRSLPLTLRSGRLFVVGVGKAAVGMARGVEVVCGDMIADGVVITKDGHAGGAPLARIAVYEAGHPIPDERGVAATHRMLDLLHRTEAGDVVLALISGGGSALLEAPRPPVTLADLATTTDLLLRAGATIQELNAVRIPLSLVKGGELRRATLATMATLILSDVLGNDPRVIASGPTVPGTATTAGARAVLDRYRLWRQVPESVRHVLSGSSENAVPLPGNDRDAVVIVGDNATAVNAAARAAAADGFRPRVVWSARTGEAADLGRAWVEACRAAPAECDVLLGGGEATVTVTGNGVGGRNTEFALAAALAIDEAGKRDWVVASLATDGQDALTGAAGAIADGETARRARVAGVDPVVALADNDSLRVFEAAGGVVRLGPTGTNVNDLYFAVRRDRTG